jgi:hypothetical protein
MGDIHTGRVQATDAGQATQAFEITPHDSNEVGDDLPRRIWVGGAGTLECILYGDTAAVTIAGIPAGTMLDIRPRVILSTGTTATLIVGFFW